MAIRKKRVKLTKQEEKIEKALTRGEYVSVSRKELREMRKALTAWRKRHS